MIELDAKYNHSEYEKRIWKFWTDNNLYSAKRDESKTPFTILMPPPNVTSQLHMGHGTGYSLQDLLIRWKRMRGFNACWLPGTDHAGIATQMMVEKDLAKDGKTKKDLGREAFVDRLHEWKDKYGGMIIDQFKELGFSCDWDRLAYTLDPKLSEAVRKVFVTLYEEGLIYRGERLVNWDCALQTAVSDDEVESKDTNGFLYHFRYEIDGSDEQIPIATTRPETMLGDTAVAVNPEDERFKHLIGKKIKLPFEDRLIPIIADDYVKSEFGTGAVKITPAHDPNDFEIGKRHNLPFISILNDDGTMNEKVADRFQGKDRLEVRKDIIKALEELGLFDEKKSYRHAVPHSERSKTVIEPKLSLQWYVKMDSLAKPAADAARDGSITFYPETWKKTWLYWLDNIQDWCISRQLWWGHRIPIWYCDDCGKATTGMEDPTSCSHCDSENIKQDEDVLDTWFSSWLWPLSPFGWPEDGKESSDEDKLDLEYFYPSDVLVTAPEIIFLWVARMTMAGIKFKGKIPFKDVYFNATVCDKKGQKFSKTLGNGIDPIEVIEKHGADAVRYTAAHLAPLGGRIKMDRNDFDVGAKFVNKVWNSGRFLFNYLDEGQTLLPIKDINLDLSQKWIINELHDCSKKVNELLDSYRINEAVETIYHYFWGAYCDWTVEASKGALNSNDEGKKQETLSVLCYVFEGGLRLLHPIIPFVTEELWQKLPAHPDFPRETSISTSAFPSSENIPSFPLEGDMWKKVQLIIQGSRSAKQQSGISSKEELDAHIRIDKAFVESTESAVGFIKKLANLGKVTIASDLQRPGRSLTSVGPGFEVYLPVTGVVDIDKEKKRLSAELTKTEKIVMGINKKLENKNFVERAPEDILIQTKAQKENMTAQLENLKLNLAALED